MTGRPIFLSYASQDAEPARRIAEGLRGAGLEVWFDQSELRGGDAWDAMIRRQVKDCALFIPIISANSEARSEGYFRLEWKLAVDRSHLMADDQTFILPIVIDDTREASARVPEAFHARQWTRLPDGQPSAQFVAHIAHVLAPTASPSPHAGTAMEGSPAQPRPVRAIRAKWGVGAVIAGAMIVAAGIVLIQRPAGTKAPPQAEAPRPAPPTVTAAIPLPSPEEASRSAAPARPAAAAQRGDRGSPATDRRANRAAPDVDLLRPAVATESEVQAIQILPASTLSAPQPIGNWQIQVELAFWETIKASAMVEDFEEYLKQYPEGRFAGLARIRVKSLQGRKK